MSQSSVASRREGGGGCAGDGRAPRDVTPVIGVLSHGRSSGDNITLFVLDERRSARAQLPAAAPRPGAYLHEWPKRKFETRRLASSALSSGVARRPRPLLRRHVSTVRISRGCLCDFRFRHLTLGRRLRAFPGVH
ncbi:hypothetical protein EVAR_18931_1 [Eumeta japonica]|uniref:Uncharacterized protein n=1 Tax=Eumeta variegata TaxID=151549 RepID=A0A4C1V1T8_EUMVA|nr:hypothetical protein EVAR_18931_1 [Eumeta japonica]